MSTLTRMTTMGAAFINAKVPRVGPAYPAKLANRCVRSLENGAGLTRGRGWDAKVSFRTAQELKKNGGLPA